MSLFNDYWERDEFSNDPRHKRKLALPAGVHLPNKNEAKMLRKIMAESGLNESEVRQIKKYRKMLADASKKMGENTKTDRFLKSVLKDITRELKLPKAHPKVVEMFVRKLNEYREKLRFNYRYNLSYVRNADILQRFKMK